jgi:23S rRNA pseudouridine1911/1915/1917 synthase
LTLTFENEKTGEPSQDAARPCPKLATADLARGNIVPLNPSFTENNSSGENQIAPPNNIIAPNAAQLVHELANDLVNDQANSAVNDLANDAANPDPGLTTEDAPAKVIPWFYEATEQDAGGRLDKLLASIWPFTRSSFQKAIKNGRVRVNDVKIKNSDCVKAGQKILFWPLTAQSPQEAGSSPPAQDKAAEKLIPVAVLYEDNSIFVINKPPGLTAHHVNQARGPFLSASLLALDPNLATIGQPDRPGMVHRLDRNTSGVMVVARSVLAFDSLKDSFKDRRVSKKYLAFTMGVPKILGLLESNLARHPKLRYKFYVVPEAGRLARSIIKVLRHFPKTNVCLVEISLLTGRTHQARIHLEQAQAPILGDWVYGLNSFNFLKKFPSLKPLVTRQLLHARRLAFPHPEGGVRAFRAPWPEDFRALWRELNHLENKAAPLPPTADDDL